MEFEGFFSQYYFCSVYEFIKRQKMDQRAIDIELDKAKFITDIGNMSEFRI